MTNLTIDTAVKLYDLLYPFWPTEPESDVLEFAGKILANIREREEFHVFTETVSLFSGYSVDELRGYHDPDSVTQLFIEGLVKHEITHIKDFMDTLGYSHV